MDETKDFYELPRYPINEKYGEIKRFNSLMKTLPFKYKNILFKVFLYEWSQKIITRKN